MLYNNLENITEIRYAIADYMKDKYRRYQIGGPPEKKRLLLWMNA